MFVSIGPPSQVFCQQGDCPLHLDNTCACAVNNYVVAPGQVESIHRNQPIFVITPVHNIFFVPDHRTILLTWWQGSPASEGCDAIVCWNMVEDPTSHSTGRINMQVAIGERTTLDSAMNSSNRG